MKERDMQVRVQELKPGAEPVEHRWPLPTLAAYLFDGRECDEVRELLAEGEGTAHGTHVEWAPLRLSQDEFVEIEHGFPQDPPHGPLPVERVRAVQLNVPALRPELRVSLRVGHPLLNEIAQRAAYLRFDYGHWADVYVATITPDEAAELLLDPARRAAADGEDAELATRIGSEDDAGLRFVVPRLDSPPPWHRTA
jgi:hypothetical protein